MTLKVTDTTRCTINSFHAPFWCQLVRRDSFTVYVCLSVCLHNMIWARVRLIRPTWPWVLFADHLAKDARRLVEKKNQKKKRRKLKLNPLPTNYLTNANNFPLSFPCKISFSTTLLLLFFLACY